MMIKIIWFLFPKTCRRIWNKGFKEGLMAMNAHRLSMEDFKNYLRYVDRQDRDPLQDIHKYEQYVEGGQV